MSYYSREEGGAVIPYKGELPSDFVLAAERADSEKIVSTFTGGTARDHYIYSYPISTKQGKRWIIGINVDGAVEIARMLGNIEVLPDVSVQEREGYFYGMVRAKDLLRNVTLLGFSRQSINRLTEGWEASDRKDEHAFVIALSKAQRNAILNVAPQDAVIRIVEHFIALKKMEELPPPRTQTQTPRTTTPTGTPARQQTKTATSYDEPPPKEVAETQQETKAGAEPSGKKTTKDTSKKQPSTLEMNKLKARFVLRWDDTGKSEGERREWLQEIYGVDSSTKLTAQQLEDAISRLENAILEDSLKEQGELPHDGKLETSPEKKQDDTGSKQDTETITEDDEPASAKELKDMADELRKMGQTNNEIREILFLETQKKEKWTKNDVKKMWGYIERLKKEGNNKENTKSEAEKFLDELNEKETP